MLVLHLLRTSESESFYGGQSQEFYYCGVENGGGGVNLKKYHTNLISKV
jgi:hypothetical protein